MTRPPPENRCIFWGLLAHSPHHPPISTQPDLTPRQPSANVTSGVPVALFLMFQSFKHERNTCALGDMKVSLCAAVWPFCSTAPQVLAAESSCSPFVPPETPRLSLRPPRMRTFKLHVNIAQPTPYKYDFVLS